ncbi:hypothetical protein EDD18DRAFT_1364410 [Armillaria luteobubalina]|uniref:Uncharacterized protein n=1 Tax=Armillaria luteobubalina TaxID=153913 RepID=A0AA39UAC3_9AGAR|nr:hypothetical protein EDD18DRAFT_1364410 [Armillaria luteobubalina]
MIHLENFRFSKMGKTKFPEATKAINRTLLDCVKLFNQNHTLDCPPEDTEKRLYEHNNSLKTCLYNLVAKLKHQAPGSLPQQMHQRQTVLKLKEPSFVLTENGGTDGRHPKNKKKQETPEEVRQEIEVLALEDAEHKKRMFQEETPESVQRALQKIELMGSEIMKVIKEAGWVCYIHASSLVPGEFYPQTLCLNIGKNEDGLTWGQHHPNYQEHMADSFAQFSSYPLILANEICQRYQDKMASIHCSNDLDNRDKIDQVSRATIAAGLEEGFQLMAWDAGAGRGKTTSVTANTTATDAASIGDNLDAVLATVCGIPPVEADVADQTTIIMCAPAYHSPLTVNMGMDMFMPMYDGGCGGNDMLSEIWDLPSLNFNSVDPSYLQLNLSHVGSSDLGFQLPLDIQQAGINAALQWDAGQSMLDPVSKEEIPYLLSTWQPVIPKVVPKIPQTTELSRKPTPVEGQDGLEEACQGACFTGCEDYLVLVDVWKDFEKRTTITLGQFPVLGQPSALSDLLKKKPRTVALPVLLKEGQKALIDETLHWWNSLQPASRHSLIPGELPSGDFPEDMGKLKKKGLHGMMQIMYLV